MSHNQKQGNRKAVWGILPEHTQAGPDCFVNDS